MIVGSRGACHAPENGAIYQAGRTPSAPGASIFGVSTESLIALGLPAESGSGTGHFSAGLEMSVDKNGKDRAIANVSRRTLLKGSAAWPAGVFATTLGLPITAASAPTYFVIDGWVLSAADLAQLDRRPAP